MEHLIQVYGYVAVLIGTFFEGETVAMLGGFAAHQQHLRFSWVVLTAFVGSAMGDQVAYFLGKRFGRSFVDRRPKLASHIGRATSLLERHPVLFILGFRFIYGLRNVAPVAIALSRIPTARFLVLNVISAAVWAVLVTGAGYLFGQAVEAARGKLHAWDERLAMGAVLAAISIFGFNLLRERVSRRQTASKGR
ncbi:MULTISPECIES: DedA family protein [Polyangium]|uniref:DedA family protein n=2 Tax=Polyangium TaxID=55 RepID=A0A4U1JAW5_9BACT|nr:MULTISPECIES: DedA family protein [Polyangium]MDI1429197.1 DedA family protein [Polyangium sorediatum]TKD06454.1 DedA family protein [Polyangium fumosum]